MNRLARAAAVATIAGLLLGTPPTVTEAFPTVYPLGTTIFKPDKTWSGYTLIDTHEQQGAVLLDMNGNVVRHWTEINAMPGPFRILPGGYVMGGTTQRAPHQESIALRELDWDGKEVWRFDRTEQVTLENGETVWAARQHHDWQREGSPVGYYAPGQAPLVDRGRTLILAHKNVTKPEISDKRLEDDYLLEVSWTGEVLWEWLASDHVDEFGFSEDARNAIHRSVAFSRARQSADWLHVNAASYVGPNRWFDGGDARFNPENVLISMREASIILIIDREGHVVWRMGPDYRDDPALAKLGQIIGQHHPHIIPVGLPGAGNLLVFDNGGSAGYGAGTAVAPNGVGVLQRDYSRVLEIDPVTFEKIWEYSIPGTEHYQFFSQYVSSAQRLPNGNTLITEGNDGRVFELTPEREIVWEYVSPYFGKVETTRHHIFRAYRVPYDWIPQLRRPRERAVVPPDRQSFRIAPR
jgi:Arylsulfotransferase (ASST)